MSAAAPAPSLKHWSVAVCSGGDSEQTCFTAMNVCHFPVRGFIMLRKRFTNPKSGGISYPAEMFHTVTCMFWLKSDGGFTHEMLLWCESQKFSFGGRLKIADTQVQLQLCKPGLKSSGSQFRLKKCFTHNTG